MKKLVFISLMIFSSLYLYGQTIETVEDTFYGTKYYQTYWMPLSISETMVLKNEPVQNTSVVLYRIRTVSETGNIILECKYMTEEFYKVSSSSAFILKFQDNSMLRLKYESFYPNISNGSYDIIASCDITDIKKMNMLTDIRVEIKDGFINFKVDKDTALWVIESFNKIKKALNK